MKTTQLKSLSVIFLLLFLSACGQTNQPNKMKTSAKTATLTNEVFTGNYIASYPNAVISAELVDKNHVVKGFFYNDGVQNELTAISERNTMTGKIKDKSNNVHYDFTAKLIDNVLHFSITFPELNNQVVELLLTKQAYSTVGDSGLTVTNGTVNATSSETTNSSSAKTNTQLNTKVKDQRLIGTWRYTEVLSSSGYGGFGDYASLSTDYFVQLKPNGEFLSWTGNSAGGSSDVSYENTNNGNVTIAAWYTEGNNIILYDPNNPNDKISIPYYAEANRVMLKGEKNTIYERIN